MKSNLLVLVLLVLLVVALISAIYGTAKNAIVYLGAAVITICVIIFIYVAVFILR